MSWWAYNVFQTLYRLSVHRYRYWWINIPLQCLSSTFDITIPNNKISQCCEQENQHEKHWDQTLPAQKYLFLCHETTIVCQRKLHKFQCLWKHGILKAAFVHRWKFRGIFVLVPCELIWSEQNYSYTYDLVRDQGSFTKECCRSVIKRGGCICNRISGQTSKTSETPPTNQPTYLTTNLTQSNRSEHQLTILPG